MTANVEQKDENITIKCSDGAEMNAFLCRSSEAQTNKPQPAIIVVHEAFRPEQSDQGGCQKVC